MPFSALDADKIELTVERLARRVEQRFPGSGLAGVVRELVAITHRASDTAAWIDKPHVGLRVGIGFLVLLILVGLAVSLRALQVRVGTPTLPELAQGIEAAINDVVFVVLALFFLVTLERRRKRSRALGAIHELRAIAHVIDMHQLTKDPEWVLGRGSATGLVPPRTMSPFELSRYLDYCSEALSLTGKVAALYVQRFDDPVALAAVNEIEDLTTGLSGKIWQKMSVLYAVPTGSPVAPGAAATTPAATAPSLPLSPAPAPAPAVAEASARAGEGKDARAPGS